MRIAVMTVFAIVIAGCAGLKPVDLPPEEVRQQVRAGQIAQPGERVSVTTEDGRTHEFKVVQVTDSSVRGDNADVLIDTIISVRTRQTDPARTVLAAAGAVAAIYVVAAVDAVDEMIDDITQ